VNRVGERLLSVELEVADSSGEDDHL
jgi:hypothetical protein